MKKFTNKELKKIKEISEGFTVETLDSVGNQIIVRNKLKKYSSFYSYGTFIGSQFDGMTILSSSWNYSATTNKYRSKWLNEGKASTVEHIKNGSYLLLEGPIMDKIKKVKTDG